MPGGQGGQWPPVANRYSSGQLGTTPTQFIPSTFRVAWVETIVLQNFSTAMHNVPIEDLSAFDFLPCTVPALSTLVIPVRCLLYNGLQAAADAAASVAFSMLWAAVSYTLE